MTCPWCSQPGEIFLRKTVEIGDNGTQTMETSRGMCRHCWNCIDRAEMQLLNAIAELGSGSKPKTAGHIMNTVH